MADKCGMKKRIPEGKTFSLQPSAFGLSGFTLIEVLVALVVLTVTASVVLESQLVSMKIEQKARLTQIFRFETQRIFSATHRAKNERQMPEIIPTGGLCRVKSEAFKMESETNVLFLIKHELSAADLPAYSTVFYTHLPADLNSEGGTRNVEQ